MEQNSASQAEVKLLKDDNWKLIQQNTFTRWVNQQLKQATGNPQLPNLETGFADGINLIKLAAVLSGKPLTRFNKKPVMRTQKLDNVSMVLNFLQREEGIKIVNIDSSHIVDHNLKLILGLIWTLILHYSLSHQHFSTAENSASNSSDKRESPKQRLLAWIQSKIPGRRVTNFTSNWNDGITLGALIDSCTGGSFGEWRKWEPADALENTKKAIQAAELLLDVEELLTPDELANPAVDEKSVMTYLAQFPKAQPHSLGAVSVSALERKPVVGMPSILTVEFEKENVQPEVRITGPDGVAVPAEILASDSTTTAEEEEEEGQYKIVYVPKVVGEHKINLLAKYPSRGSKTPALVESLSVVAIPAPVVLGLGRRAVVGERRRFMVENVTDHSRLDVAVVDPEGKECVLDASSERDANTVTCCYTPKVVGTHTINVLLNKQHIPESPFTLEVFDVVVEAEESSQPTAAPILQTLTPASRSKAPTEVTVWGRGIFSVGTSAHEELSVHVDNCEESVQVSVKKDGLLVPVSPKWSSNFEKKCSSSSPPPSVSQPFGALHPRQSFSFTPRTSGNYEVFVATLAGGVPLGKSPYSISVGPKNSSSIRAVGPGLEGGVAEERAIFYIDTHGRANFLEFSIEGPSKTEIVCSDNGEGTALVEYTPRVSGRYTINITELDTNSHIKDSPFALWIDPANSLPFRKVQRPIHIPPLEDNEGQVGRQFGFTIPSQIEAETVDVEVFDPNLSKVPLECSSRAQMGSQANYYSFTPTKEGKHLISVVADKLAVDGWPFLVSVHGPFDPNNIWLSGPALSPTIQTHQKTNFAIDVHSVPKFNRVEVGVSGPDGVELPVEVDLRTSSVYNARFEPSEPGVYKILLHVNEQRIFEVPVHAMDWDVEEMDLLGEEDERLLYYSPEMGDAARPPHVGFKYDISEGLPANVGARMANEIPEPVVGLSTSIVFTAVGQQHLMGLNARIKGPADDGGGGYFDMKLEQIGPEQFRLSFVPHFSGLHTVEVRNERGDEIYGSPFKIPVALLGTQRAHMAWANGPGLAVGTVGCPNPFNVWNAKKLGGGELTVSIDGPGKAEVGTVQHDNNYQVEYTVQLPGLYTISVLFNDAPITGSPFKVFVKPLTAESLSSKNSSPQTSPGSEQQHYDCYGQEFPTKLAAQNGSSHFDDSHEPQHLKRHRGLGEEENNNNTISGNNNLLKQNGNGTKYDGDHRLVQARGGGLDRFLPGKPNEFIVDTSATGINTLFVGAITSSGPTDELNVRHNGGGIFLVSYTIPHNSDAMIFVKYGDEQIPGSPFLVRPSQQLGDGFDYGENYSRY